MLSRELGAKIALKDGGQRVWSGGGLYNKDGGWTWTMYIQDVRKPEVGYTIARSPSNLRELPSWGYFNSLYLFRRCRSAFFSTESFLAVRIVTKPKTINFRCDCNCIKSRTDTCSFYFTVSCDYPPRPNYNTERFEIETETVRRVCPDWVFLMGYYIFSRNRLSDSSRLRFSNNLFFFLE